MHFELTPFFVPRLPFRVSITDKKKKVEVMAATMDWCGAAADDLGTSRFFFSFSYYDYC